MTVEGTLCLLPVTKPPIDRRRHNSRRDPSTFVDRVTNAIRWGRSIDPPRDHRGRSPLCIRLIFVCLTQSESRLYRVKDESESGHSGRSRRASRRHPRQYPQRSRARAVSFPTTGTLRYIPPETSFVAGRRRDLDHRGRRRGADGRRGAGGGEEDRRLGRAEGRERHIQHFGIGRRRADRSVVAGLRRHRCELLQRRIDGRGVHIVVVSCSGSPSGSHVVVDVGIHRHRDGVLVL